MRKIALILLLAGSWAGAANFYVDAATGLDSKDIRQVVSQESIQ
ncbi:MAG TPA: hypothetical protein PLV57_22000 [Phycisphaerae bacterium]|nr:hypothetical protein [Phycisphaerae bacterium]HPP29187.1 hypothetical protein [Phycisphaerae bacterium]